MNRIRYARKVIDYNGSTSKIFHLAEINKLAVGRIIEDYKANKIFYISIFNQEVFNYTKDLKTAKNNLRKLLAKQINSLKQQRRNNES